MNPYKGRVITSRTHEVNCKECGHYDQIESGGIYNAMVIFENDGWGEYEGWWLCSDCLAKKPKIIPFWKRRFPFKNLFSKRIGW
ncbi:MAG: hypothetical protein ACTSQA_01170 [Candidatus Heimdallarchaeaceae archaeon]